MVIEKVFLFFITFIVIIFLTVSDSMENSFIYGVVNRIIKEKNQGPTTGEAVYFIGDSLTYRHQWQNDFPQHTIVNKGVNADQTSHVLKRLDEITNHHPKKIFLLIGINDLMKRKRGRDVLNNYESIIKKIKKSSPNTEIYVQSLLPIRRNVELKNKDIIEFNKKLKIIAMKYQVRYVDLHTLFFEDGKLAERYTNDGLHLTSLGYQVWINALKPHIK